MPGTGPQCNPGSVKIYDSSWTRLTINPNGTITGLKVGDKVRITVAGIPAAGFDKARFTINGTLRPGVTTTHPRTGEFYDEYTIPAGATTFTVIGEVHNVSLNRWFGK